MLSRSHRYSPSFVLLLTSMFASMAGLASSTAHAQGIAWRHDLASAQAEASQANKLVLIHFWTPTCAPCKRLEKVVFNSPGVAGSIARDYVPVKINAAASPEIASKYQITRVPTDVVVTSAGQLVKTFVSPATPMAYVGLMGEVASAYRSQHSAYNQIASKASFNKTPASERLQPAGQPLNPAYSGLATVAQPTVQQVAAAPGGTPKQTIYDRYAAAAPQPPVDRYAMKEPTTPVVTAPVPVVVNNPVASQSAPPVTPIPATSVANPHYAAPAATTPAASPAPAAPEAVAPTPRSQSIASQLPPGSPALGFDGFCPVTMKNKWRWAKGDVKWGAIHRGRTYLFVNQAARDTFLAEPDKYSPALSGADPVLAVETQQVVPGTREYAVEYEGQFYLFSNEQSLKKFWSNADGYAKGAERIASKLSTNGIIRR